MPHWRAIQVVPQREFYAHKALASLDIPLFMPTFKARRHRRGSPWVVRPLLPGYLFADLAAKPFSPVRRCRWVIRIIGTVPIPVRTMVAFQNAAQSLQDAPGGPKLLPGHTYRLRNLHDALAKLEALDDHGKARIILRMFGVERVVTVAADDLEEG